MSGGPPIPGPWKCSCGRTFDDHAQALRHFNSEQRYSRISRRRHVSITAARYAK
jgi:hypothetical protein